MRSVFILLPETCWYSYCHNRSDSKSGVCDVLIHLYKNKRILQVLFIYCNSGGMLVVFSYCTALAPNPLLSSGGMFCCVGRASVFFIYVGLNEGIYLRPSLLVEMAPEFDIRFGMVVVFLGVMKLLWVLLRFILL